jgi:hypothetical protein
VRYGFDEKLLSLAVYSARGIIFKEVISKNLASYVGNAYVYKWSEPVTGDGVPQVTEIVQVYPTL